MAVVLYPQFLSSKVCSLTLTSMTYQHLEWVEKSWSDGFPGAEYFKGKIVGTKGRLGTNDVAALFRYFGVK